MSNGPDETGSHSGYAVSLAGLLVIGVGVAATMMNVGDLEPIKAVAVHHAPKTTPAKASKTSKPEARNSKLSLERTATIAIPGAEIVAYDTERKRALVTCDGGVAMVQLAFDAAPTLLRTVDVAAAAGFPRGVTGSVTHIAIDPAGRGFAAVTVVPSAKARMPGAVVFIGLEVGTPLASVGVGFNPDAVAFSSDGKKLVIANEGEPEVVRDVLVDPAGSVSIIDLTRVKQANELESISPTDVLPLGFHGDVIGRAFSRMATGELSALRIAPANKLSPDRDIEPESLVVLGDRAYVTLQENSGIAAIDLSASNWVQIRALPPVERKLDASDKDGRINIDDTVACLPCPDQVAGFEHNGRSYLVICEEGDDRGDADVEKPSMLADQARLGWLASRGRLAPAFMSRADLSDAGLGRLRVCAFSGDPNNDGSINSPVALGTRSVAVLDAQSLARIGDTGSQLEEVMAKLALRSFNANGDDVNMPDVRSDDRGPEPEGIAMARIGSRPVAFVSLERPGGIAVIDLSTPADPNVVTILNTAANGDIGPEGVAYVSENASPTSKPLLLVAFEQSGSLGVYRVEGR